MAKRIVIALGGNALGSTLHEQADAVQITARAIVDLIAEGHEVIVAHGNGPQGGIINTAMLAGSGTIRACAAGFGTPELDAAQMAEIHRLIEQELAAGALGVSLGLGYAPDCFYSTEALIEALQPLKNSGIPITVHMRQEGSGVVDALREMITVAKALHTPVEVSHLKSIGKANWHRCTPELRDALRKRNLRMVNRRADIYLEMEDGTSEDYVTEDMAPFDLSGGHLDVPDNDYGIWYVDMMDAPGRYEGVEVSFKALMCHSKKFKGVH